MGSSYKRRKRHEILGFLEHRFIGLRESLVGKNGGICVIVLDFDSVKLGNFALFRDKGGENSLND